MPFTPDDCGHSPATKVVVSHIRFFSSALSEKEKRNKLEIFPFSQMCSLMLHAGSIVTPWCF